MRKIMFDDKYGLTEAVLTGRKTMTRRVVPAKVAQMIEAFANPTLLVPLDCIPSGMSIEEFEQQWKNYDAPVFIQPKSKEKIKFYDARKEAAKLAPYKIGEEIAIAQRYSDFRWPAPQRSDFQEILHSAGWNNKMFVKASMMPHRIRITDVKVERLQDISDEDCAKEGIIYVNWRQYLKQDMDDFSPQPYKDHDLWTLPIFEESFRDAWAEQKPGEYAAKSAKVAFAVLIFKLMGKKVWEQNPWVFAYEFELLK